MVNGEFCCESFFLLESIKLLASLFLVFHATWFLKIDEATLQNFIYNHIIIWKMYKGIRKREREKLQEVNLLQTRCQNLFMSKNWPPVIGRPNFSMLGFRFGSELLCSGSKLFGITRAHHHQFNATSVACAIGPSVNPLQNKENQHVNIVLQCLYPFFEQPNTKRTHTWIEWWAFKCNHVLNWFFLPKLGFLEFIWIFSSKNISYILNPHLAK
jgi:hypothetical protein